MFQGQQDLPPLNFMSTSWLPKLQKRSYRNMGCYLCDIEYALCSCRELPNSQILKSK